MQERHRNRGALYSKPIRPTPQTYNNNFLYLKWWRWPASYSGINYTEEPGLVVSSLGINIPAGTFPQPDIKTNQNGQYYASFSGNQAKKDQIAAIILAAISTYRWELQYSGSTHADFVTVDTTETMTDVIKSQFVSKQGKEFVVNPCTSDKKKFSLDASASSGWTPVVNVYDNGGSLTEVSLRVSITLTPTGFASGLPLSLYNSLLSQMGTADIQDANSTFQDAFSRVQEGTAEVLTMIAESGKTYNYLFDRLKGISTYLIRAKKALFTLSPSKAADIWLETRYAIRPLIMDVESIIASLKKGELEPTYTFRKRDTNSFSYSYSNSITVDTVTYQLDADIYDEEVYTAGVYTRLRNNLPSVHTYGLANFAQTAWEVVPWSFVIDWFVNISGFIASVNPSPVYRIENGFKTSSKISSALCTLTCSRTGLDPVVLQFVVTRKSYTREKAVEPSLINLNVDLNIPKMVDLLALARRFL